MEIKLKEYRTKSKITQKEIARLLCIPQTTYSSYETGKAEPDIKTLIALAKLFNISLDELLGQQKIKTLNKNFSEGESADFAKNLSLLNRENLIKVDTYVKTCLEFQQK